VRDFRTALKSYFGSPPLLKLEWEAPADEWLLALSFVPGDALHLQTVAFAERGGTQADVTTEHDLLVFRLPH
jgi:hypothetical protein